MELGEKDSLTLLNTNIKVFNYIPTELTSYEIGKLKKLIHKPHRQIKDRERQKGKEDILDDLFIGLIVDQTIGCWYLEDRWDKYRVLRINKLLVIAHRLSYEIFIGPIILPFVCHHCDRPGCQNPWHLFNGTHANNMEDARLKGKLNKPKVLTPGEKFLLWKHVNSIQDHFEVTREAVEDTSRHRYEAFKINDYKR